MPTTCDDESPFKVMATNTAYTVLCRNRNMENGKMNRFYDIPALGDWLLMCSRRT